MPGRQITLSGMCLAGASHLVASVDRDPSDGMLILWVIGCTPIEQSLVLQRIMVGQMLLLLLSDAVDPPPPFELCWSWLLLLLQEFPLP